MPIALNFKLYYIRNKNNFRSCFTLKWMKHDWPKPVSRKTSEDGVKNLFCLIPVKPGEFKRF
jgi:hypothetical protein